MAFTTKLIPLVFAFVLFCIAAYVSGDMSQKLIAAGLAFLTAAMIF